jgi:hypothetical protein
MASGSSDDDNAATKEIDPLSCYAHIGAVASVWSVLERAIDRYVWRLAGVTPEAGACLTTQIQSIRNKLIVLETLINLRGGSSDLIKRIRKFQGKCEGPSRARNRIVHDPLVLDADKKHFSVRRLSADRVLVLQDEPPSLDAMEKTVSDIIDLHNKFREF